MTSARIPRSTTARRAGGPTKARKPTGELALVPDVPRQVRRVTVVVEQLDDGLLRFTAPKAPGWVAAARGPVDVVRALRSLFVESQVAAHADWRGSLYDHPAAPQLRRHKPRSRGKRRADVFDPTGWVVDDRGYWVSPGAGHRYREDRQVVSRVKAARKAMGLPERPGRDDSRQRLEQMTGVQMALRLDDDKRNSL